MYGMRVHQAVVENKESKSGISIHYVNEEYDKGDIIFQAFCELSKDESPESLAVKIHDLEYKHFPMVVEKLIKGFQKDRGSITLSYYDIHQKAHVAISNKYHILIQLKDSNRLKVQFKNKNYQF